MSEKKSEAEIVVTATAGEKPSSPPSSPISKLLGFILLVAVIIAGGLAANGQLMPLVKSIQAKFSSQVQSASQTETTPAQVVTPAVTRQATPVIEEPAVADVIVKTEETQALLSTIEMLRSELQNMESSQQSLRQGLL